jgi:hypothetical protein
MRTLTVAEIMALNPCGAYPEDRVRELWRDRDALTLVEILCLDIPPEDRIWVLTRYGVLPDDVLRRFAHMTADRAVRNHCLTCGVAAVETWARGWLDGTDRTSAAAYAARAAAYAAYAAAYVAARAAAYAAAYVAARAAARAAADAAADAAAYGAARAAAYAAERQAQIADLLALLEDRHD